MARARPIYYKDLGKIYVTLREAQGWTQRQAGDIAERRKLEGLTRQVLLRLEKGQTKNPGPEVLKAVASLYSVTYEQLAAEFIAVRYGLVVSGIDLIRHDIEVHGGLHKGGTVDQTHARLLGQLADAKKTIREMRAAANKIGAQVAKQLLAAEGHATGKHQSRRGKSGRGVG